MRGWLTVGGRSGLTPPGFRRARSGVVLAAALWLVEVGCSRPLPYGRDAGVTPGTDAGTLDVPRESGGETPPDVASDAPPDIAPDLAGDRGGETPPDTASDRPGDVSGEVPPGDARDGGDGGSVPAGRPLTLVINGAPWGLSESAGFTVDAAGRLFRADAGFIYVLEGGAFRTYMSIAEAVAQLRMSEPARFIDLDTGSDGLLYILLAGTRPNAPGRMVARSASAHVATSLLDVNSTVVEKMRVVSPGKVVIVDAMGMWTTSATGGQYLYPPAMLGDIATCHTRSFDVRPSGVFLFGLGCDRAPMLRGSVDGSSVGLLYHPAAAPIGADNFICMARDPAGGFYMLVSGDGSGGAPDYRPRLYHVSDDANGTSGFTRVATTPTFDQARTLVPDPRVFTTCSMAVAPDGTIFLETIYQLWQLAP
jgi:hypothetical protein